MRLYYLLILTLSLLILILGSALYLPERVGGVDDFTQKENDGAIHIRITENGFEPKNIHIRSGDKVVWTNEGEKKHWPASNDHPTHQGYPEKSATDCADSSFDSCKGLEKGESWSFTFSEEGMWRYHDHLFPSITGSILIGEAPAPSSISKFKKYLSKTTSCPSHSEFKTMMGNEREESMLKLAKSSPKDAWECLKADAITNGSVTVNVHDLAHIIGNEAYKQSGIRGIAICDTTFAYGCFHGVTEQLLREQGPEVVLETAKECRAMFPINGPRADSYTGCLHGMGHGLLSWEGMNLKRGLERCSVLPTLDRTFCFDGVFMEYSSGASLQGFDANDPWATCRKVGEEFHTACARYQPNIWKRAFLWDNARAAQACITGESSTLRDNCIDSIGFIIAQSHPGERSQIKLECGRIDSIEYKAKCETAAALENKFQRYNGWESLVETTCRELPPPWSEYCSMRLSQTTQ